MVGRILNLGKSVCWKAIPVALELTWRPDSRNNFMPLEWSTKHIHRQSSTIISFRRSETERGRPIGWWRRRRKRKKSKRKGSRTSEGSKRVREGTAASAAAAARLNPALLLNRTYKILVVNLYSCLAWWEGRAGTASWSHGCDTDVVLTDLF